MRYTITCGANAAAPPSAPIESPPRPSLPQRPARPLSLLDLPAEIRNRIYRSCFSSSTLLIAKEKPTYDYSGCLAPYSADDQAAGSEWKRDCHLRDDAGQCREQHGTAASLLGVSKQILTEALPFFYQEVDVWFENVDTFANYVHLGSFASAPVLQSRPPGFSLNLPNAFSTIQSLRIGDFVKNRFGGAPPSHRTQCRRLLENVKYNMPQLKSLYLQVNYPSTRWNGDYRPDSWYLDALSQLQVLQRFHFGTLNVRDYLKAGSQRRGSNDLKSRQLAVAYRYVLSELVTGAAAVSQADLATWRAIPGTHEIWLERRKMVKSLMWDYLTNVNQIGAATQLQTLQ